LGKEKNPFNGQKKGKEGVIEAFPSRKGKKKEGVWSKTSFVKKVKRGGEKTKLKVGAPEKKERRRIT